MLPRSLFLKIFVWFMVVVITVITVTSLLGELMRPDHHGPPQRRWLEPLLAAQGQTAAELYERDGQRGLLAQLDRLHRETNVSAFLFDRQLQELSGRRVPEGAPQLAGTVFQTNVPQFSPRAVPLYTGNPYVHSVAANTFWSQRCGRVRRLLAGIILSSMFSGWD